MAKAAERCAYCPDHATAVVAVHDEDGQLVLVDRVCADCEPVSVDNAVLRGRTATVSPLPQEPRYVPEGASPRRVPDARVVRPGEAA